MQISRSHLCVKKISQRANWSSGIIGENKKAAERADPHPQLLTLVSGRPGRRDRPPAVSLGGMESSEKGNNGEKKTFGKCRQAGAHLLEEDFSMTIQNICETLYLFLIHSSKIKQLARPIPVNQFFFFYKLSITAAKLLMRTSRSFELQPPVGEPPSSRPSAGQNSKTLLYDRLPL